jgi:hypothetical protein
MKEEADLRDAAIVCENQQLEGENNLRKKLRIVE